jgi:hypothetical protein
MLKFPLIKHLCSLGNIRNFLTAGIIVIKDLLQRRQAQGPLHKIIHHQRRIKYILFLILFNSGRGNSGGKSAHSS